MLRASTTFLLDMLIITGLLATIGFCASLASPDSAGADQPKKKPVVRQSQQSPAPKAASPGKTTPEKGKAGPRRPQTPPSPPAAVVKHPSPQSKDPPKRRKSPSSSKSPARTYHGTFSASLAHAPFPLAGKDADPQFFDFVDPKTGERFRTTRTLERLSEKEHYRDGTVLFHIPSRFNPNKPFLYVVFFHGNRSDVQESLKDHRLADQIENSGRNAILILPQLARNAADSSPGKFARKDAFRSFMSETARTLSQRLGKKHLKALEQAPILLAAFSGGYKPLACTLDRGGVPSRIKGVLLLDALYDDLYIFGRWLLNPGGAGVFMNIYTQGSACEEKTERLARFLRDHGLPFKEAWPKRGFPKRPVFLIGSPFDHMQIPKEGPPREPLAALLRNLRF